MPLSCSLLGLSTEVLIEILSYLPATDLISIQRTCHTIRDIVAGTTYLQYILCLRTNGLDDFSPPDFPYSERLRLLHHHEQSWKAAQFNFLTRCVTNFPYPDRFILQDGYVIYEEIRETMFLYGYANLCSSSQGNELHWIHITMDDSRLPIPRVAAYAIDHDLVITIRFVYVSIPSSVQT